MQHKINKLPKGKVEVSVDLPKAQFAVSYDKVLVVLGKGAKIPGFRPGKAPKDVVITHVGANKVLNETASFLINKHLSEIFQKEKFVPIDSPNISISSLSHDGPFSFTATFTLKPTVKLGDWKKIKVTKVKPKAILDKDVDASVKNIFEAWKKQKKAVGENEEEKKEEGGKFIYDAHGNKIEVKDEEKPEDKAKGEAKIDDEFAKAVGARDLKHLKELVRRDLENIVVDQSEAKAEQEIFEKLLEVSQVEIPDILVDDELNRILVRLNSQLEEQGREMDDYLKEQNMTIDKLKETWREQAEKNVKTTLIMDSVGREGKITVTPEEIQQAMGGVSADSSKLSQEQKADMERYVTLSIFQAKTLSLVKKTVLS